MQHPAFPAVDAPALKQTVRIAAACTVAFAAFKLLGLQQGYWAVFTVLIVMQGSIGSTLGAAFDRVLGTLAGAILGALGAWINDGSNLATGATLVAATAIGSYAAVLRPQLRIAPVTASVMMLTMPPGTPIIDFVFNRVVEIILGGFIGVAAMALILPARAGTVVADRIAAVLDAMHAILGDMADALASGAPAKLGESLGALRPALAGVELALKEADREQAARLARHAIPPEAPLGLWRLRSDLVLVARALDPPFPDPVRLLLGDAGAAMLDRLRTDILACAVALRAAQPVKRMDWVAERQAFSAAFSAFRTSPEGNALDLGIAGHVFAFSFALDELARDVRDLIERIDETSGQGRSLRQTVET